MASIQSASDCHTFEGKSKKAVLDSKLCRQMQIRDTLRNKTGNKLEPRCREARQAERLLSEPQTWFKTHGLLDPESELPGDDRSLLHPVWRHPDGSFLWTWNCGVVLTHAELVFRYDSCRYGTLWRRRFRIAANSELRGGRVHLRAASMKPKSQTLEGQPATPIQGSVCGPCFGPSYHHPARFTRSVLYTLVGNARR